VERFENLLKGRMKSLIAQFQDGWGPGKSLQSIRTIAYWTFTFLVAFEMMAGGIWDLLRIEYVRVVLAHLGYPMYLLTIIGVWKIPCAIVLFLPGFLRLKEWAYAGAVFNYTGAAASHLLAGERGWAGPAVLTAVTLASWVLRPPARRLPAPAAPADRRVVSWLVPSLVLIILFMLSFVFLPTGPPPAS
jgi:hypothetical protein